MSGIATHLRKTAWIWVCVGFFLLSRAPIILCPYELNVDESQLAAQAMRYGQNLTPWQSVDGESNGPMDSWFLLAAHAVGLPLDYRTLHLLAALCQLGIVLATCAAARRLVGGTPALVALAAGMWWLSWAPVQEFEHFASELVPCLLLSVALAAIIRGRQSAGGPDWRLGFLGGAFLSLAPWGKLQAAPVALALGIWAVSDGLLASPAPLSRRRWYAASLVIGAILPSAILLTWVIGAGAGEELWRSYVIAGMAHTAPRSWLEHLQYFRDLVFLQPGSPWFCDVALLALGALLFRGSSGNRRLPRAATILALVLLGAGLYATLRPITQWAHYALFCLPGLVLCAALAASSLVGTDPFSARRRGWAVVALGIVPLPVGYFFHHNYFKDYNMVWHYETSHAFDTEKFLDQAVRYYAPQAKSLAVWGWKPSLYVDLGLPPSVRNAGYVYLRDHNPSQEFLREAFLRDLEHSAPDVIVDVEDFVQHGRRHTPPEIFPALASYLASHYRLAGQGKADYPEDYNLFINVYVRSHP